MIDYRNHKWHDLIVSQDVWDALAKHNMAGRLPIGMSALGAMLYGVTIAKCPYLGRCTVLGMTERGRRIVESMQIDDVVMDWRTFAEGHCPK